MEQQIKKALQEIETNNCVKVLYACESGSRAWGFPSKDSDYCFSPGYLTMSFSKYMTI